jgi:uncharacterized protein YfiM (DUF2279 family)
MPAGNFDMGIGPVNRVNVGIAVDSATGSGEDAVALRQIVAAISGLNNSGWVGRQRELRSRRNRNGRLVVELIHSETGEVLGELPLGEVLHMAEGLQRDRWKEDL